MVDADVLKANFVKMHGPDAAGAANAIAEACKAVANPDRCEFGYLLSDCIIKTLVKKPWDKCDPICNACLSNDINQK